MLPLYDNTSQNGKRLIGSIKKIIIVVLNILVASTTYRTIAS